MKNNTIDALNAVIISSTANGGDSGGPYMSRQKWAVDSINNLLKILQLDKEYECRIVQQLKSNNCIWIDMPQIIEKN